MGPTSHPIVQTLEYKVNVTIFIEGFKSLSIDQGFANVGGFCLQNIWTWKEVEQVVPVDLDGGTELYLQYHYLLFIK